MDESTATELVVELRRIARAISLLCLVAPGTADKPLGVHARLLKSIGFENSEIAELLNSTSKSIGVRLTETKSWRPQQTKPESPN